MKKTSALGFNPDRMIAELEQLVVDQRKGDLSKYKITQVNVPPIQTKTAYAILRLREKKLKMSRGAFAKVLNVPTATLRAWENGKRHPSGAAVRLLDLVDKMPHIAFSCLRTGPLTAAAPATAAAAEPNKFRGRKISPTKQRTAKSGRG